MIPLWITVFGTRFMNIVLLNVTISSVQCLYCQAQAHSGSLRLLLCDSVYIFKLRLSQALSGSLRLLLCDFDSVT